MNNEAVNKVFEYIDAMAANLGVASEHVYALLVRQQIIGGIIGLLFTVIIVVGGYFTAKKVSEMTLSTVEKAKSKRYSFEVTMGEEMTIFLRYAVWVAYGIVVIVTLSMVPGDIGRLINPEYYAIKEVLNVFGK